MNKCKLRNILNKKLKIAIIIMLIVGLSFKSYITIKKHVHYKRVKKPIQFKKVNIKHFSINKKPVFIQKNKDEELQLYHVPLQKIKYNQDKELQQKIDTYHREYKEKQERLRKEALARQEAERQRIAKIKEEQKQEQLRNQQTQQNKQKLQNNNINNDTNVKGRKVKLRISYYTVSMQETGKTDGICASGVKIYNGSIAAPSNIPFKTKISIPGMGVYTVEDRGGAIGYEGDVMKIDVYVPNASQSQLNKLGVKYTIGYILN